MRARHILSRFAADGLISHMQNNRSRVNFRRMDLDDLDSAAEKDSEIIDLAQQVLKRLDDLESLLPSDDASDEVAKSAKGSTLALFSGSSNQISGIALLQCAAALEALASRPATAGRLIVRSKAAEGDKLFHVCSLVLAFGGQGTVPAELAGEVETEFRATASCVWEALDSVLGGKCRNAVCINRSTDVRGEVNVSADVANDSDEMCGSASLCMSSIVGAVLQARMQYQLLSKIAVIVAFEPSDTPCPCIKSSGIRLFSVCVSSDPARATSVSGFAHDERREPFASVPNSDAECRAWRTAMEAIMVQVGEYMPDLLIVSFRCFPSKRSTGPNDSERASPPLLPRKLSTEDWSWAGRSLETLAGRVCKGRLIVVWDLIGSAQLWHANVADLTLGMLPISE